MADQEISQNTKSDQASKSYIILLKVMSKRRTWAILFILVYTILLSLSWNILKSVLTWYQTKSSSSTSSSEKYWPAIYASVLLGAVFGVISMVAALAVALPAMLITWITILVLLAFAGKSKRDLVVEGQKITCEILGFVFKILLKEGILLLLIYILDVLCVVHGNTRNLASSLYRSCKPGAIL